MKKAGFYIEDAVQESPYNRACRVAGQCPAADLTVPDSMRSLHALTLEQLSEGMFFYISKAQINEKQDKLPFITIILTKERRRRKPPRRS